MTCPEAIIQQRIEECQGLVRSLAGSIHRKLPPTVDLDDLIAYGQVGLGEAARDFDPARGSRFSTYAYYRIRGAVYDGLTKMSWFERAQVGRNRFERMSNEVFRLESEDNPSPAPRSTEDEMRWFRNVTRTLAVVYLASHASSAEGGSRAAEAALVDESSPDAPEVAISHEMRERLHKSIDALPPMVAQLVRAVYFEGLTLQEAGERLGVSKSWASRLHTRALEQLARSLRCEGISA
jgi:RNA polymerase sigma factor FliA